MTEKLGVTEKEPAFGQKTPDRTGIDKAHNSYLASASNCAQLFTADSQSNDGHQLMTFYQSTGINCNYASTSRHQTGNRPQRALSVKLVAHH